MGVSLAAPDLSAAGYRFIGGRIVATKQGPAALFAVEPFLGGHPLVKGLVYVDVTWVLNAAVVLPLIGEGFAGDKHLSFAGIVWFAAAHTIFFVTAAVLYRPLRANSWSFPAISPDAQATGNSDLPVPQVREDRH